MTNKLIKIALIGNTNAGKSTFMNSMVGEIVSIINKKINTTNNIIMGIVNIKETQIIYYDTPGSNFLNTSATSQKKFKCSYQRFISQFFKFKTSIQKIYFYLYSAFC